ncbi:MAG: CPBP family intramembrane metalloprotease [Minicystis sp.]
MRERWARDGRREAALRVVAGYALLATLATALALALRDGVPWVHPDPWLVQPPEVSLVLSAVLGVFTAVLVIALTRVAVRYFAWAQRLHSDLRPVARDLGVGQILLVAGLSSLGEELLFRGLLVPTVGIWLSAAAFGLAHQMKGPSRWVWAGWATAVGLLLGAIFALTGSLVGPLLAHALVNAANLTYLRDHDPAY